MVNGKKAKLVKHEVLASSYHDLVFETEKPFQFEAGQFISVQVTETRVNSYSIAGKVSENQFGLLVDIKPGGDGSKFFENLRVGDEIDYLGPLGKFVLHPDDGAEKILFLGTGSGIAPLKAMVEKVIRESLLSVPMELYFGLRNREDLFWDRYFAQLADEHEQLSFYMCLSKPDESWLGLKGHITDFLEANYPDCSLASAYLCGSMAMIEEARAKLIKLGMREDMVYHEKFY